MSVQVYLKIKIEIEKQFTFNGYNYLEFPYKKKQTNRCMHGVKREITKFNMCK
jgi:hypothetical protein